MARRTADQARLYEELAEKHGRLIANAFMSALDEIRSRAEIERIIAAYEVGDLEGAIEALHMDQEAFDAFLDAIREAHSEAGRSAADLMPKRYPDGTAMVIRFEGRNPQAEGWLTEHSSRLVTRTVEDMRQALRNRLVAGMQAGENPRRVALDIVGRINRVTGKRDGGVLGLTAQQEAYVRSARQELASGEARALKNYLRRERRDRRFDRSVRKALEQGKPVPAETRERMVTAYTNRLLNLRGEVIARTEAMASMHHATWESLRQAVASGKLQASQIRRIWRSARDPRVRDSHAVLDGESVGLNEAFVSPFGARLMFPGDASQGAPASEIVACRCWCETRIDFFANLR